MPAPPWTLLSIDEITWPEWAARSINMTLEPIDQAADMRRDVLGELVDLALAQFRKYRVSIACSDQAAPVLTDVWPGKFVTIHCVRGLGVVNDPPDDLTLECLVTRWDTAVGERTVDIAWRLEAEQV